MLRTIENALGDLRAGLAMRRVWIALASEDIGDQHRRTALGPLWLLVNYLAFAGIFVVIFGAGSEAADFPAYVAIGLFVWLYLAEVIGQATALFVREESFIKGTTLPLSVYVLRLTAQSLMRALYALAGCVAILFVTGTTVGTGWLWAAGGLALIVAVTPAAIIVFATAGAFFPDIQFIVANLMRLGMFLTPVFWVHGGEGRLRALFYYWNPFTYFLEIVRQPVLTDRPAGWALAFCATTGLVLWALALTLLGRYRKRIVFVL